MMSAFLARDPGLPPRALAMVRSSSRSFRSRAERSRAAESTLIGGYLRSQGGRVPDGRRVRGDGGARRPSVACSSVVRVRDEGCRSEEHTSELQSLMRISYAVFCLKKKKTIQQLTTI